MIESGNKNGALEMRSKKPRKLKWQEILLSSFLFISLVLISLVNQPGRSAAAYNSLFDQYDNLLAKYTNMAASYNLLYDDYIVFAQEHTMQTGETIEIPERLIFDTNLRPLDESNRLPVWRDYVSFFALLLMGGTALLMLGIQRYRWSQAMGDLISGHRRDIQKALDQGRRETTYSIANELVKDKDVMTELAKWLLEYEDGVAKLDQSARIHSQVLTRIMKQIRLNPIGKLDELVSFDPVQHSNYENLKPNEPAYIQELGWRIGREMLKRPVVRRKK